MSVKRYSVGYKDSASGRYAAMLDKQDGGYVSHDDFAALEQHLIESERYGRQTGITIDNLEMKLEQMAAENAGMDSFVDALLCIAWQGGSADGAEIQELALKHGLLRQEVYSADEHETLVDDPGNFEDGDPVYFRVETPATDAFLAEVRACAIPEGYVLVPQQIFLEPSDIESICSQCGDGHESGYGDFTDGLLWVGNIQRDDGSIVHGLHISSADYSEDGGVTVCEFAAQLRKGVQS